MLDHVHVHHSTVVFTTTFKWLTCGHHCALFNVVGDVTCIGIAFLLLLVVAALGGGDGELLGVVELTDRQRRLALPRRR